MTLGLGARPARAQGDSEAAAIAPVDPRVPTLTVRGTTRIELERMERTPDGVLLTVRLLDDDLDAPVQGRQVVVSVRRGSVEVLRRSARTNQEGRAQLLLFHQEGRYQLALSFPGDEFYTATPPEVSEVDLSKGAVRLRLEAPARVDLSAPRVVVRIQALHDAPVPGLDVRLRVRQAGRLLHRAQGVTGEKGAWETVLDPSRLGAPGPLTLEATTAPTGRYNRGHVRQRVLLVSRPKVSLKLQAARVALGAPVKASGRVWDARGPLPDAQVQIQAGDRTVSSARTDARGRYAATVPSRPLGPGTVEIRAAFVPSTAWYLAARSPAAALTVRPPAPIPVTYYLLPVSITALLLLALWAAYRRPWRRLAPRARRAGEQVGALRPGVELGSRSGRHRRTGPLRRRVSGRVVDLHDGTPVPSATVHLRPLETASDSAALAAAAEPDGAFSHPEVPPGRYRLVVAAPGWIPQSMDVAVPHRGELEGVTVRLLSVRREVMRLYTDVVAPLLPGSDRPYLWTPAEVVAHLRSASPPAGEAVTPLAHLAAEVRYGASPPGEDAIEQAEALAAAARAHAGQEQAAPEARASGSRKGAQR